jgi:hypothetical protein
MTYFFYIFVINFLFLFRKHHEVFTTSSQNMTWKVVFCLWHSQVCLDIQWLMYLARCFFRGGKTVLKQPYETGALYVGLRRGKLGGGDYQCPVVGKEVWAYVRVVLYTFVLVFGWSGWRNHENHDMAYFHAWLKMWLAVYMECKINWYDSVSVT